MKAKALAVVVLLASVSLATIASLWWIADLNAQSAYFKMDRWEKNKKVGTQEEWGSAFAAMQQARKYNPYSVDYMIEMGQLYEWSAQLMTFQSDKRLALQQAKKQYRQAVERRPTWPHAWANLAYVKALLGEKDNELYLAIGKVMKYGPWIKIAQRKAIAVSLTEWKNLPPSLQKSVITAMQNWLDYQDRNMRKFIIEKAVEEGRSYIIRLIVASSNYEKETRKLINKLVKNKSTYCSGSTCYKRPVYRFDERFEV